MEIINGIIVQGTAEVRELELQKRNALMAPAEDSAAQQQFTSSIAGHIIRNFFFNRDARRSSGIEDEMFESLRSYNGEYSPQDLALIRQTGGSEIYINIVGVKSRAAASWIRDIQMPAKLEAWSVEPTPVTELPDGIKQRIDEALKIEFGKYVENFQAKPIDGSEPPPEQPQQGQAPSPPTTQPPPQPGVSPAAEFTPQQGNTSQLPATAQQGPAGVAQTIKEFNEAKRDIEDMMLAEINKIAKHEMKKMEREIADKLAEGGWTKALSDFIDDFVVFPTAFIKGPIISRDQSLSYENGQPVVNERYAFLNKRISSFDMYPSPNSTTINDGSNLIEHCRFIRRELLDMRGLPGYKDDAISKVLKECETGRATWVDSGLESDKALDERRGSEWEANTEVIHGLHFHGSIPVKILREWQMEDPKLDEADDEDEFEVDAILAHNHVIKCALNTHPLKRRPYYKASYQTRPGSFWGRSLPSLMSDIQRMCNAAARALANNMGLASGPQIEIYVDRLADAGKIENIHPFKIWQLTSDPTGAGGRAIQFTQPTSNAAELLKVYQEFEVRADDATGIPRYSYGNERVGGAAMTATGLAMLLESASKAIKDCVRNIDEEVIIPRIEMQFYWTIRTNPSNFYSGDPKVVARGSSSLTMKGAEQMRRNEFLQITANEFDMAVLGKSGRAELLRSVASDLNIDEEVIPSRLEMRAKEAIESQNASQMQQQNLELQKMKLTSGLEATKMQIDGQERMHTKTQQVRVEELGLKERINTIEAQLKMAGLDIQREAELQKHNSAFSQLDFKETKEDERFNTEVALKLQKGEGI